MQTTLQHGVRAGKHLWPTARCSAKHTTALKGINRKSQINYRMRADRLKDFIQPANINFLIGSGLSYPYLSTLGNVEVLLAELDKQSDSNIKRLVKGSIYKSYFESVIRPNLFGEKKKRQADYDKVADSYYRFLETWNQIIHNRGGSLLPKQVNIFTTNIDTLIENSAEQCKIELNDGFKGSVNPVFDEGNFHKSYRKNSVHFQNSTELPVFNLLKMHGSINWSENEDQQIINDFTLSQVQTVADELAKIGDDYFVPLNNLNKMIEDATQKINGKRQRVDMTLKKFEETYEELILINPTKRKFSETVTDVHFYDLMRMYSNALERENSLLFVMGFSFADEHILKITERALRTNPTLLVVIFAYNDEQEDGFNTKFQSTNNVCILTPTIFNTNNKSKDGDEELVVDTFNFDGINEVFRFISDMIPVNFRYGK
jgi:hypothetical protein